LHREERAAALNAVEKQLDLLHAAVEGLESTESLVSRLGKLLDAARDACPITAAAVRDEHNSILAASEGWQGTASEPVQVLSPQMLLPLGSSPHDVWRGDIPFPKEGGRLALVVGKRQVGWLELWGNGSPASARSRRALSDATRLIAAQLAGDGRRAAARE